MVHALAALSTLLRVVLSDAVSEAALSTASVEPEAQHPEMSDASRLLAVICGRGDAAPKGSPPIDATAAAALDGAPSQDRMRVERSASWLHATATQLGRMLPALFSMLRRHPRGGVRAASVRAADELLLHCARTLPSCTTACLESLLCLAHDPWPQVADAACSCLQRRSSSTIAVANGETSHDPIPWRELEEMLVAHVAAFETACKRGEADATVAARLLAGTIGVSGPVRATNALFSSLRRTQLCRRLTAAFVLDGHGAQPVTAAAFVASEPMQLLATKDAAFLSAGMMLPRRHARFSLLASDEVRADCSWSTMGGLMTHAPRSLTQRSPMSLE